ncbi:MAG: hypothetical protein RL657_2917 [Pseudomonadota bacterium]
MAYKNLLQIIGFQLVWFAWALGVPRGWLWPGALASCLFLLAHGQTWRHDRRDRSALLLCVCFGFVLDSVLMHLGWLSFEVLNPGPLAAWQPWWMLLLWACLGCTLHHSLAWLKERVWLAVPLCGVAGVLSYQAAAEMGALSLPGQIPAWLVLTVFWACFLPWAQHRTGAAGHAAIQD